MLLVLSWLVRSHGHQRYLYFLIVRTDDREFYSTPRRSHALVLDDVRSPNQRLRVPPANEQLAPLGF
ncbi:hypothetical protein DPMN_138829 [Dreissena polymorpha]|uniref:Uncharacterized protein n=1 Tax=Dreissena polymorpha TaxID=45954 RepID=A0A9D4GAG8_DREPO|nr:hypothetical protein DPMN_138829 [Dreissena polymorpha]